MINQVGLTASNPFLAQSLRPPEYPAAALAKELAPLQQLDPGSVPLNPSAADLAGAISKPSFPSFLENAIHEIDGTMRSASSEQTKVMTGETNNLHQAMISMQEASVAFSLMVEVRNKLVESYQELMRMQV